MDRAPSRLLSFSPGPPPTTSLEDGEYDKQIRDIVKLLSTTPAKQLTQPIDGKLLLESVDPAANSIPYLYALCAQTKAEKVKDTAAKPSDTTWTAIERFIASFDAVQVRYVGHQWRSMLEDLLDLAEETDDATQAHRALMLVQAAMLRLDPTTSTFTSTHLGLVRVCLLKRDYAACERVLANDIYHLPARSDSSSGMGGGSGGGGNGNGSRPTTRISAQHALSSAFVTTSSGFSKELTYRDPTQYLLFGAMIYIARRKWDRAFFFLELVLVTPVAGNTASMIQAEAYKKWLLVGILLHGRPPTPPRTLSPHSLRLIGSVCKPYGALADAYKETGPGKLKGEFRAGVEDGIWQKDGNQLLVQAVVDSHRVTQLLTFGKIYASIPIDRLARLIADEQQQQNGGPEDAAEVEREIREIIAAGKIRASISTSTSTTASLTKAATEQGDNNGSTTLLRFLSADSGSGADESPAADAERATRLRSALAGVEALNRHVADSRRRLELTRDYAAALRKKRAKEDGTQAGGLDGGDGGSAASAALEEDMLADM